MKLNTIVRFGCCVLTGLILSHNHITYVDGSFWILLVAFAVYGVACYNDGKAGR